MDTEITDEFQQVLDLLSMATPPVVFVTGSAGTGKSTLIDVLRSELDKNLVVVAPTGVAALNVQGQIRCALTPAATACLLAARHWYWLVICTSCHR